MDTANQRLRQFIASRILFTKEYPYSDEASFLEEGIIDSTNILEIIMFIEDEFNLSVEDDEILPENFDSLQKITTYIGRKGIS